MWRTVSEVVPGGRGDLIAWTTSTKRPGHQYSAIIGRFVSPRMQIKFTEFRRAPLPHAGANESRLSWLRRSC